MKLLLKNRHNKSWNGVPATARQTLSYVSLYESFFASIFWHFVGILLIWAITFSLMFFGVIPKLFPMQKAKIKDIEFTLNGKHMRHRIKHAVIKPEQSSNTTMETKPEQKVVSPSFDKTASKSTKKSISEFSIPMPNLKSLSSGLEKQGKTNNSKSAEVSNSTIGNINDAFSKDNDDTGTSSGFNKNATKKMITTFDISPYINELKRNIRWNWSAPKDNQNKKVELFLRIAKDGKIIIFNVKHTSEIANVDNAALNAVKKCLPLNPLPSKYGKSYLDVIFTFGSNSIGSRY